MIRGDGRSAWTHEMARYVASVETPWDREDAFAYVADFATIDEWDPGVASSWRLGPLSHEIGARFEVRTSLLGRESRLVYEIVELEAPWRVVLEARTSTAVSRDEITFNLRPGGGTIITYDARFNPTGAMSALDLPLRPLFRRIGTGPAMGSPPSWQSSRR